MSAEETEVAASVDTAVGGVVVEAHQLERQYGEGETAVHALRGVSLEVERGHLVAVMGPSGSGKSTLMHTLAGLDKPTSGTVTIAGTEITGLDDAQMTRLRRDHIGFVFQFFNLLPMLSAEENVLLPLSIAGEKPDRAWLEQLLAKTGLADRRAPPALGALGRPAAAGGDRPRAGHQADDPVRRRADREPRFEDRRRDPRAAARLRTRLQPDDRDGDPRGARRRRSPIASCSSLTD